MIRVQCPKCEKKLGVDDSKAGGVGVCPECGQRFRIPGKPARSGDKPNPGKGNPAAKKQATPAKQAAAKPASQPTRPKEPWEEEDSSPYAVHEVEEHGEDALKVEYGVDKDYEKKLERKRLEEEKQEFHSFIGVIVILIFVGVVVNCLPLIMPELVYVPMGLGVLISLAGLVMLLVLAFRQDILQVLLVLFCPLYDIFFTVKHFKDARNALAIRYIGAMIFSAGLIFGGLEKINGLIKDIKEKSQSSTLISPAGVFVKSGTATSGAGAPDAG